MKMVKNLAIMGSLKKEKVIKQYKEIQKTIKEGVELGYLSKEFGKKLYLLPKIQKKFI